MFGLTFSILSQKPLLKPELTNVEEPEQRKVPVDSWKRRIAKTGTLPWIPSVSIGVCGETRQRKRPKGKKWSFENRLRVATASLRSGTSIALHRTCVWNHFRATGHVGDNHGQRKWLPHRVPSNWRGQMRSGFRQGVPR